MNLTFEKAVKHQEKLRLALDGPAGSGKTWTALIIATDLAERQGGRAALIDSERSSARKYASNFDFDHLTLPNFEPETYRDAVRAAVAAGYAVVIIDSLSHAWEGVLERKDNVTARSRSKNSFDAWRTVTPIHNELVDTILRAPVHVIATLRTKTEYVVETGDDGKNKPRKIGMRPIQRDGTEYEFDVVGDMDQDNTLVVSKTRCPALNGQVIRRPDAQLADTLWTWLNDGEPPPGQLAEGEMWAKDAKARLLEACGGDKAAASTAWDFAGLDGRQKVTESELNKALDELAVHVKAETDTSAENEQVELPGQEAVSQAYADAMEAQS